jgi:hypothetical protein
MRKTNEPSKTVLNKQSNLQRMAGIELISKTLEQKNSPSNISLFPQPCNTWHQWMTVDEHEVRLEPNSWKTSTKDASNINFLTKQVDHRPKV